MCRLSRRIVVAHGGIKSLSIRKGELDVHLESPDEVGVTEKIPVGNLRMRSRRATVSDCMCFLRPGVDICILSKDSGEEKVWIDAKVNSIARTPHESGCTCRFFVNLYRKRVPSDMRWWTLNKEIMEVTIDDISIRKPSEDEYYRWSYLKDCPSRNDAKLLRLQFSCDLSWMLVASTLKGFDFEILSMRRKIFYQFLEDNQDICSTGSDKALKFVNFYMDDDVFKPNILTIVPESALISSDQENTSMEDSLDDQLELRRSGRKSVQPERYVGNPWSSNVKSAKRTARVREVDEEPWEMSSEDNDWWDEPIVRTERTHDTIPNLRIERKRDTIHNLRAERKHDSIRSSNLQLVTYEVNTGSMDQPTVGIKRNHENMQASNLELVPSQINIGGIDQPVALDMKTNDDCMHGSDEMESSTEQLGGDVISVKRPRYADPPVVYETSKQKKDLCRQQVQHCDSISKQSKEYFMSRMNRYSNLISASNIDSPQAEKRKAENKEEGGPSVSSKSSKGEKDLCEKVQHYS
ncbi:SNF2 domain-containing protein CLASSY 1-like [Papaver somniferum]|uniref:SNF2 domain-containing protein CLASSY 1-like n=1 Tax=Papaver somniferum TaxID=3469 RepID=UPI000E6F6FAF|nr:SNF2 domain-containing protein CLASSY 1-like [Papaver somniferum]